MSTAEQSRTEALIVTADLRAGMWLGRVIDGEQTVFDAEPATDRSMALHRAYCSPAVRQARRDCRPVKLRTVTEQEQADQAGEDL